jgi:hypothetical protein
MIYLALIGAVLMVWTLLRILGDERQRRIQVLRATVEHERRLARERRDGPA